MTANDPTEVAPQPKLVQTALPPFRALLWTGLALLILGLIVGIVGLNTDDYDNELARAGALAFSGGAIQWAVPFIVGAGVIAGLGKREE